MTLRSSSLRGAFWMSGAVLCFCVMAVAVRELLRHMGTFEVLFMRTAFSLLLVLALVPRIGIAALRTSRMDLQLWRNLTHLGGQAAWVYAIGVLPLAAVFAIEFTFPVWTAILAVLFLGEQLKPHRMVMLVLGLAGVLIILRPGFSVFQPASLVMLLGSLCFAVQMILTKRIAATDSPYAVIFWMSLLQTPVCLALAAPNWVTPGATDWPWIVLIGVGSFSAHFCLTRAMNLTDAIVVTPIDFFRLPLIAVVGAVLYGEPFDVFVMAGAVLIFAGTYYSVTRERA